MTFPDEVERWRSTAGAALADVLKANPSYKSLLTGLQLTVPDTVDTILAIVQKESSGDPAATGDIRDGVANSWGLMQLNYGRGTPQDMGYSGTAQGLQEPYTNLFYGAKYYLYQLRRYMDRDQAIAAYNAGSFFPSSSGGATNQSYVDDVLTFLGEKKTLSRSPRQPSDSRTSSASSSADAAASPGPRITVDPPTDPHPAALAGTIVGGASLLAILSQFVHC